MMSRWHSGERGGQNNEGGPQQVRERVVIATPFVFETVQARQAAVSVLLVSSLTWTAGFALQVVKKKKKSRGIYPTAFHSSTSSNKSHTTKTFTYTL